MTPMLFNSNIQTAIYGFDKSIQTVEQGDFYEIYRTLEYIVKNRNRKNKIKQDYNFLDLCDKCKPELIQKVNGKKYFHRGENVQNFAILLMTFSDLLWKDIPIKGIYHGTERTLTVYFNRTEYNKRTDKDLPLLTRILLK
jgi:hypothetical protein